MLNRNFTFLHYVNGFCVAAAVSLVSLADSQVSFSFFFSENDNLKS